MSSKISIYGKTSSEGPETPSRFGPISSLEFEEWDPKKFEQPYWPVHCDLMVNGNDWCKKEFHMDEKLCKGGINLILAVSREFGYELRLQIRSGYLMVFLGVESRNSKPPNIFCNVYWPNQTPESLRPLECCWHKLIAFWGLLVKKKPSDKNLMANFAL